MKEGNLENDIGILDYNGKKEKNRELLFLRTAAKLKSQNYGENRVAQNYGKALLRKLRMDGFVDADGLDPQPWHWQLEGTWIFSSKMKPSSQVSLVTKWLNSTPTQQWQALMNFDVSTSKNRK